MGGPSGHGQRNKAHKAGRTAGLSAREKARKGKEAAGHRVHPKQAAGPSSKLERHMAAKQMRDSKRQELLAQKRHHTPPLVVAILPLSAAVDIPRLWHGLRLACLNPQGLAATATGIPDATAIAISSNAGMDVDSDMDLLLAAGAPLEPVTVVVAGRTRTRMTLLPPPVARCDPLAIVDIARAADVILLALPAESVSSSSSNHTNAATSSAAAVDNEGELALSILRALGLPNVLCCVAGAVSSTGGISAAAAVGASMKDRSAWKRRAEKALESKLSGEHRVLHAHNAADMVALARSLSEQQQHPAGIQHWRNARGQLLVEKAELVTEPSDSVAGMEVAGPGPSSEAAAAALAVAAGAGRSSHGNALGTSRLRISGYVRCCGLTANQVMHVPGAGDFPILAIYTPPDPHTVGRVTHGSASAMDLVDDSSTLPPLAAKPDPEEQDSTVRENIPDFGDAEQTWPTEQELADAEMFEGAKRRRRVPAGTSDYQAAWILDSDEEGSSGSGSGEQDGYGESGMDMGEGTSPGCCGAGSGSGAKSGGRGGVMMGGDGEDAPELAPLDMDDAGTDAGDMDMEEDGAEDYEEAYRIAKAGQAAAGDAEARERDFPDEVEVPTNAAARIRFQKYRGLKSLRTSPWDSKEELPADYARVFAFENFRRAHKRAKEIVARATAGVDPAGVQRGLYVTVELPGVPTAAAAAVAQRVAAYLSGQAAPLSTFALMQHECKMSVANFSIRKATGYPAPIANKQELLFVTGLRSFVGRPILSSDDAGMDKHKMERFLATGDQCIASVFAPISYPPLPLLAFAIPAGFTTSLQQQQATAIVTQPSMGALPQLAAVGSLRSCDPDRIVLKKIVLTGLPVRVNKRRATVRFMFHQPDDVRWFRPVEVYTKYGRRGRITEPLGTHGGMKVYFDQPIQQRDTVCLPLYKRVFPKWPADLTFA